MAARRSSFMLIRAEVAGVMQRLPAGVEAEDLTTRRAPLQHGILRRIQWQATTHGGLGSVAGSRGGSTQQRVILRAACFGQCVLVGPQQAQRRRGGPSSTMSATCARSFKSNTPELKSGEARATNGDHQNGDVRCDLCWA